MSSRNPVPSLAVVMALLSACVGQIGMPGESGGAGGGSGGRRGSGGMGGGSGEVPPDPLAAGTLPLRRLTRSEYNNTVRDLLGDTTAPANEFAGEGKGTSGFASPGAVSDIDVRRFMEAAEGLAASAVRDLPALLRCDPAAMGEETCVTRFIASFGRRAYRRPLASAEVSDHLALYTAVRRDLQLGFADGVRVLVQALLQSPHFLYRWELGPQAPTRDGAVVRLNDDEVAARLSYFLWSSMPDGALFAAADAGRLGTPGEVEAEARRLLADPRARDTIDSFHVQWLGLERLSGAPKDPGAYPQYTDGLKRAMEDETRAFVSHLLMEGDGRLETLLAAPFSFLNEDLARLYGVAGVTGATLRKADLDPTQRAGILTHASVLSLGANAYETSPIHRGKLIREQLICQSLPPPPPNIPPLPPSTPGLPTRERFAQHSSDPACSGCHALMDPIGFGLENFDAIGRHRTAENGMTVDASGKVADIDGGTHAFDGARGLAAVLASSDEVRLCIARKWFRFAFGREESAGDEHSLRTAFAAFAASGHDIRSLLLALTTTRSFLYRAPSAGEATP